MMVSVTMPSPTSMLTLCVSLQHVLDHAQPLQKASDAEGTIRVIRTLLAADGHAFFVIAHPRTRFGVDALAPLLERSPDLDFTCEEISEPQLVAGLEEAEYLAWMYVHVWWASSTGPGREFLENELDLEGDFNRGLFVSG